MAMSKSDAGKLGGLKSIENSKYRKQLRINQYLKNPKHCEKCNNSFSYEKRHLRFCNTSCAASFNNLGKLRSKKTILQCEQCNNEFKYGHSKENKYCSVQCHKKHKHEVNITLWLSSGTFPGWTTIKKYLTEIHGYRCKSCGVSNTYNNKSLVLEIEHKDGNSLNNSFENLCYLCPNCHSQTDTYKGKNKGKGRYKRMERYYQGKSY